MQADFLIIRKTSELQYRIRRNFDFNFLLLRVSQIHTKGDPQIIKESNKEFLKMAKAIKSLTKVFLLNKVPVKPKCWKHSPKLEKPDG